MSDYEEDYSQNEDVYGYPSSPMDHEGTVIVPLTVFFKKDDTERTSTVYIKFFGENEAFDAETARYIDNKSDIETIINRRYPGCVITGFRTEEFSSGTYFDLDYSSCE